MDRDGLVRTQLPAMSVEGEFVEVENDIFYGTLEEGLGGQTDLSGTLRAHYS